MELSWKTKLFHSKRNLFLLFLLHGIIGWLCYSNFVRTAEVSHFPIFYEQGLISRKGPTNCHANSSHTKVIAYSIYGSDENYWHGFPEIFSDIQTVYPGWTVFIYADDHMCGIMQTLIADFDFVNLCCVSLVSVGDVLLTVFVPTTWRFFLMGEPNVDTIIFRDSDAKITQREAFAVEEWLQNSNATLHAMRDHPWHIYPLMAGMFGLRQTEKNRNEIRLIRDQIFLAGRGKVDKAHDQEFLSNYLYPVLRDDAYFHDSYLCTKFEHTFPYPTQRVNGVFVGAQTYRPNKYWTVDKPCPVACRPKNHQDWEFC